MTVFSGHKDLIWGLVVTPPAPDVSGTTLTVSVDTAALLATVPLPFYATAAPDATLPIHTNAEVVEVTNVVGVTVTIVRAQGGTSAKAIAVGWQFYAGVSSEWADEVEAAINAAETDISDHISDPVGAHAASAISITDPGGYFTSTDADGAFQELGADVGSIPTDYVAKAAYDANSILHAVSDNTPVALSVGASTILARLASGDLKAASPSELRTLLDLVVGTNVQAYDADLTTWAGLTPSAFFQTLVDDTTAAAARATLVAATLPTGYVTGRYYAADMGSVGGSVAVVNGTAYAVPIWVRGSFTADRISVYQYSAGAASSVVRMGIYNDSGNMMPGSLLLDAGTYDSSTGSNVTKEITISQALTQGLYWLVVAPQAASGPNLYCSNGTAGPLSIFMSMGSTSGAVNGLTQTSVTGAFGTPFTTSPASNQLAPLIWLRAA